MRPVAFVIALALSSLPTSVTAETSVRYEESRLWLRSDGSPASQVFSRIADETGVRFLVDPDVADGPVDVELEGLDLERAVRHLVLALPKAAGHTMSYVRDASGNARLVEVKIYAAGQTGPATQATLYEGSTPSVPFAFPTPDLEERLDKMVEAGVPRETAEKVIDLTREVQRLQSTPEPGSFTAADLPPESRDQLDALLERGVPEERAVQMLLLQERYQETLKELSTVAGTLRPTVTPAPE